VNACFAVCGDGTCDELEPVITYDVTFQLTDSPCEGNPWVTGSMDGWSGWGAELKMMMEMELLSALFTGLTPGVWEYNTLVVGKRFEDSGRVCLHRVSQPWIEL
jgi:hypothetical protein